MSGQNCHFSVGECGGLGFKKGTVRKIFDLRTNGESGTVKNGYFVPFSPIFLPFLSHFCSQPIFLNHIPPQPSTTHIPCAMPAIFLLPPISPIFPIFPILPDFKILVWCVGEFGGGERVPGGGA